MIRENGSEYGTVYIFLLNLIKTAIKIRFDWKFILISVENVWNLYVKNLLHYGYVDIFFINYRYLPSLVFICLNNYLKLYDVDILILILITNCFYIVTSYNVS